MAKQLTGFIAPNGRPTVGLLLASLHTGASRELWPGLLDAANRNDVNLISFPGGRLRASHAYESQRNQIFDLAGSACLNGLVTWASSLGGVLNPNEISAFHQRYEGLAMVSLAQFMEGLPTVAQDSYQGMRSVVTHLIAVHGYHKLAFIRGPEEHYYAQERYRAYLDTLRAFDLPLIPELVTRPLSWESGAEAVEILLDERGLRPGVDFQAIVTVSDMLAIWVLKTLQARGFDVPGDVAITGYNNSIQERLATPPLTTVSQPFYEQGAKSIDVLVAMLNGNAVSALLTLPSTLVVRQSCGCPSKSVAQAAYIPPVDDTSSPDAPKERLKDPVVRQICLADLAQAGGAPIDASAIFDGLLADLPGLDPLVSAPSKFLQALRDVLVQAITARQDINLWHGVVSAIRKVVLPGLSLEKRAALEVIIGQARMIVNEMAQRSGAYWQWQAERLAENLREINRSLLTTFDVHQLGDVLFDHLPSLEIPSAYLVLYDGSADPPVHARLMMAYTEQGRAALPLEGYRFATRELIPPEFLPQNRRYSLVVEPLFFQEKSLGYAVFEVGPRNGDIYETVRANLSSAIQGALLFQEIQQARLTAEKADRIKTRLLANVSHEMRAPLNIILGYTQNLLQSDLDPALRGEIEHIQTSAGHQLRVINDLLDLSRAEIDELDLNFELLDPRPLLIEAFQSISGQDQTSSLEWKLDLPARLPMIRADAVRLRQILLNLLSNARKFTETGQVTLGAEVAPPYTHFWIQDTGWGIPPEQQERIFEPFVTMEQGRRISGGIGLGLSITRHLVALQGGKMSLDSQPGKGSTFHFYIPLPVLDQDRATVENAQPVLLLLSSAGKPAPEIKTICERQNLQICLVRSPDELEAALANTRPLAVAWDLTASRPGDWHLIRRLRPHPALSQAPFILYGRQPENETDLAIGLTSFVTKTPNQQSLLETILALCPAQPEAMILIVDDDPQVRAEQQAIIAQALPNCAARFAEDGETALQIMAEEAPSLVLLDLMMPGLSGADVLDHMRDDPRLRQVPVIILSNKLLSLEEVKRIEQHTRVTMQSKGIWSETETVSMLNRALFGTEILPAHTSALVKRAVVYLQQNYAHSISRWEVAEAVGVSEDYLTRVFSRELEISPWDYLNRFRILQAQKLLTTTAQSIGVIARQVGFSDQAYFTRVFSKHTGISPQAYRDMHG